MQIFSHLGVDVLFVVVLFVVVLFVVVLFVVVLFVVVFFVVVLFVVVLFVVVLLVVVLLVGGGVAFLATAQHDGSPLNSSQAGRHFPSCAASLHSSGHFTL